jgi:hypothetical protein
LKEGKQWKEKYVQIALGLLGMAIFVLRAAKIERNEEPKNFLKGCAKAAVKSLDQTKIGVLNAPQS